MRERFLAAVILAGFLSSPLNAARIFLEEFENKAYAIYLQGEELDGLFDTVIVDIRPDASFEFANVEADFIAGNAIVLPGAPTYRYEVLFGWYWLGAYGFSVVGESISSQGIEFTSGQLGNRIDSRGPNMHLNGLFLVNIRLLTGTAKANMLLVRSPRARLLRT